MVTTQKNCTERHNIFPWLYIVWKKRWRLRERKEDEKDDRIGITRMLVYNFIMELSDIGFNKIKGQELRAKLKSENE